MLLIFGVDKPVIFPPTRAKWANELAARHGAPE